MKLVITFLIIAYTMMVRADNTLVKLADGGMVQGHHDGYGNREWNGIPFAKPPVGDLRFEWPQPAEKFTETYQANYVAPGCMQSCNLPYGSCPETMSEDCLYLTVFAPPNESENPDGYPVFYWMHGGAFTQGAGDTPVYNGTHFASLDVVNVVMNYRLGAMGYMASPSMQGNYGLMDQILALKWTNENIHAFGGDPAKITIAGQSAGAESSLAVTVSPMAKGLFLQTILQSDPLALPSHSRQSARKNAKDVFKYVGCEEDDVACIKTAPADKIVEAQHEAVRLDIKNLFINFQTFSPMIDPSQGPVPVEPFTAFQEGDFPEQRIMAGHMLEEGWLFVYSLFPKTLSSFKYDHLLQAMFGRSVTKQVLDIYPYDLLNADEDDGRNPLAVLATDLLFVCPLRNATRSFQKRQAAPAPINIYRFKQVIAEDVWEPSNPYCVGHVCHGSELPFVFNVWTDNGEHSYTPTSDEKDLQNSMANAWANFITNADPNTGLPVHGTFPVYNQQTEETADIINPGWETQVNLRQTQCDFWDTVGYFW